MSHVYFVSDGQFIKIGTSKQAGNRLRLLRSPNGRKTELIGTMPGGRPLERALHDELWVHRRVGEWFEDCPAVRQRIAALMAHSETPEPWTRLTIDLPESLHHRIKTTCYASNRLVTDVIRELLEQRFPKN